MALSLKDVLANLVSGVLTPAGAAHILTSEASKNPRRATFWSQQLQAEISAGRVAAPLGRILLDAMETFQPDRTMWLESANMDPGSGVVATASSSIPSTPGTGTRQSSTRFADIEALRAALFDSAASPTGLLDSEKKTPQAPPTRAPESLGLSTPDVGTTVEERYRLTARLGFGGAGHVFNAVDLREDRGVTLEFIAIDLSEQPEAYAALHAAAQRTQSLAHRNIASVYDIDRDGNHAFVVMEPLHGRWLSQLIREVRGQGLAYDIAWPIIAGIVSGLAHAHRHGVMHLDLSPNSIFLCADGVPKIVGFGLMRAAPSASHSIDALDTQTLRAYSEAYSASASNSSIPHPADDLYPLGVMAHELLAGTHPFQRFSLKQAEQRQLAYPPLTEINKRAQALIARCVSFEREARAKDADRLLRGLGTRSLFRMRS